MKKLLSILLTVFSLTVIAQNEQMLFNECLVNKDTLFFLPDNRIETHGKYGFYFTPFKFSNDSILTLSKSKLKVYSITQDSIYFYRFNTDGKIQLGQDSIAYLRYKGKFRQVKKNQHDTTFYNNGQIARVRYLAKNGTPNGEVRTYYPSGKLKTLANHLGHSVRPTLDGIQESYYENGQKYSVKKFKRGIKIGTHKSWHSNGKKSLVEKYPEKLRRLNKKQIKLHQQLYKDKNWKNVTTNRGRKLYSKSYYFNGSPKNLTKYYRRNGRLNKQREWYKNGKLKKGKTSKLLTSGFYYMRGTSEKEWFENGNLKKSWDPIYNKRYFRINKKVWYKNGNKKEEKIYKQPKGFMVPMEIIKKWHSNGQLKEHTYSVKEGPSYKKVCKKWTANGEIIE